MSCVFSYAAKKKKGGGGEGKYQTKIKLLYEDAYITLIIT